MKRILRHYSIHCATLCVACAIMLTMHTSVSAGIPRTICVSGTVTDFEDGQPMAMVSVVYAAGNSGTYSRIDGRYTICIPDTAHTLEFRFVGYERYRLELKGGSTSHDIVLRARSTSAADIVITPGAPLDVIRTINKELVDRRSRTDSLAFTLYSVYTDDQLKKRATVKSAQECVARVTYGMSPTRTCTYVIQARRTLGFVDSLDIREPDGAITDPIEPYLKLRKVSYPLPLAKESFGYYHYEFGTARDLHDTTLATITFRPKSTGARGFTGYIVYSRIDTSIRAVHLSPIDAELPYMDSVAIDLSYDPLSDNIWLPVREEIHLTYTFSFLTELLSSTGQRMIVSTLSDVTWYSRSGEDSGISPLNMTDSTVHMLSWDIDSVHNDSILGQYTIINDTGQFEYSRKLLARQDTSFPFNEYGMVMLHDKSYTISLMPSLMTTSITGSRYGAIATALSAPINASVTAYYQHDSLAITRGSIFRSFILDSAHTLLAMASYLNDVAPIQRPLVYNQDNIATMFIEGLNSSNFGFFEQRGFELALGYSYKALNISNRYSSITQDFHRADIKESALAQRTALSGKYDVDVLTASLFGSSAEDYVLDRQKPLQLRASVLAGKQSAATQSFYTLSGDAVYRAPLLHFDVGTVYLRTGVMGGYASERTPVQYQLSTIRRYTFLGSERSLSTLPMNTVIGREYLGGQWTLDFGETILRAIGFPSYQDQRPAFGLVLGGAVIGNMDTIYTTQPMRPSVSMLEAGCTVMMPLYFTDLFRLRMEAMWNIGGTMADRPPFRVTWGLALPILE